MASTAGSSQVDVAVNTVAPSEILYSCQGRHRIRATHLPTCFYQGRGRD